MSIMKIIFYSIFLTLLLIKSVVYADNRYQKPDDVNAKNSTEVSDDTETPDALLENIDVDVTNKKYTDNDSKMHSENAEKDPSITSPDLLEQTLQSTETNKKSFLKSTTIKGDKDAVKKRRKNFSSNKLVTPDPLLDSVD